MPPRITPSYTNPITSGRVNKPQMGPMATAYHSLPRPGMAPVSPAASDLLQRSMGQHQQANTARNQLGIERAAAPAMASLEMARQGAVDRAGLDQAGFLADRYGAMLGRGLQQGQLGLGDARLGLSDAQGDLQDRLLQSQWARLNAQLEQGRFGQVQNMLPLLMQYFGG